MSAGQDNEKVLEDLVEVVKKAIDLCKDGMMILDRRLIEPFPMALEDVLVHAIDLAGRERHVIAQLHFRGEKMVIAWLPMERPKPRMFSW